jgi:hypothetical protein
MTSDRCCKWILLHPPCSSFVPLCESAFVHLCQLNAKGETTHAMSHSGLTDHDLALFASKREGRVLRDDEEFDPFFGPPVKRKKRRPDGAAASSSQPSATSDSVDDEVGRSSTAQHDADAATTLQRRTGTTAAAAATAYATSAAGVVFSSRQRLVADDDTAEAKKRSAVVAPQSWREYIEELVLSHLPCLRAGYITSAELSAKPKSLTVLRDPETMLRAIGAPPPRRGYCVSNTTNNSAANDGDDDDQVHASSAAARSVDVSARHAHAKETAGLLS